MRRGSHACVSERESQPNAGRSLALAIVVATALAGCGFSSGQIPTTRDAQSLPGRGCVERGGLPDVRCTPGAVRAGVSLATICAYSYTRSVRPPERYTEALKITQIREYHLPGRVSDYEEDHLIALSIGGAPTSPANLWPEPRNGPNNAEQKDRLETWAARMACAQRIPLQRLQGEMAGNWLGLYRAAGGPRALDAYPPGG